MKYLACALAALLSMWTAIAVAENSAFQPEQSPHFALLIGNSSYTKNDGTFADLPNACDDVKRAAASLVLLGWKESDVIYECDLDKPGINRRLDEFVYRWRTSVNPTAIFYFAGHGAQVNNRIYAFGVGAHPNLAASTALLLRNPNLSVFPVEAEDVREVLQREIGDVLGGALLVILDSCRDNPLIAYYKTEASALGPSVSISAPKAVDFPVGMLTDYSTAEGAGAQDQSPFAQAFSDNVRAGVPIRKVVDEINAQVFLDTKGTPLEQRPVAWGGFFIPPGTPDPCFSGCAEAGMPALDAGDLQVASAFGGTGAQDTLLKFAQAQSPTTAPAPTTSAATPPRVVYEQPLPADIATAMPSAPTINVDVFWCDGDDVARSREITASQIAASIGTYARLVGPVNGVALGNVRVRSLPKTVNNTADFNIKADQVVYNADQTTDAAWADAILKASLTPLTAAPGRGVPAGYLKVYACKDINLDQRLVRVYFQIARTDQRDFASAVINLLALSIPNVSIARGIDLEETVSPDSTEVRYYYAEDKAAAEDVAKFVQENLDERVKVKSVAALAYAAKIRPGTVEVWLGKKTAIPVQPGQ